MPFYIYENHLSKSLSHILKILFQTGDINIFVLRGVFFSRYVQLKSSFSDEKYIAWNLRHASVEKLSKTNMAKYERKILSLAEVGALQCYSVQNCTENANGDDVPLTVENV